MRIARIGYRRPHWRIALVLAISARLIIAQDQDISMTFKFGPVDERLLDEVNEYNRQIERKGLVFHDDLVNRYVDEIGRRVVVSQPPLEKVEFRFRVLRDPMVNAFAFPNGTVYVTSGLLARLENEAELASVLGHEATHVIRRHSYLENRSMRKKALAINILQGAAVAAPGGSAFGAAVILGANLSAAILAGTIYGYSQDKEREADRYGLDLIVAASYDPGAMPRTFELLTEKLEFEPIDSFYRTHPKLEQRRKNALEQILVENLKEGRTGAESDYLEHTAPAICANIEADLNSRRARTARARASRLVNWRPDEPKYEVLLADAYRSLGAKTPEPTAEEERKQGQAEHRNMYFQMTEAEEQRQRLAMPEGAAIRERNLGEAERLYQSALQHNPQYADAHRGLGFLYEQESNPGGAAQEYRKYLEMTNSTSLDRLRIERRLAEVERASKQGNEK
jgi:beta-barrel assembly-enhancing protease